MVSVHRTAQRRPLVFFEPRKLLDLRVFKDILCNLGVTILCLSQINRNVAGRPTRANLRDSGEIDEASHLTLILYRPEADMVEGYPYPYENVSTKNTMLVDAGKYRSGGQT